MTASTEGTAPEKQLGQGAPEREVAEPVRRTRTPQDRWRRLATAVVAGLAVVGVMAAGNFFFGPPGVGHFRSAEGRQEYAAAYSETMDLLPGPSAVHDVQTAYGSIRVYEWSTDQNRDETPVLLVPGRAAGAPMWMETLPELVPERRVLAFDALGDSGLSEQSVPFAGFVDQAHPIDDVVRVLAPEGVHIVGHSFGGAIAAAYARQYSGRTVTMTLLEPAFTLAQPPADLLFWAVVSSLPLVPEGIRETALENVGGVEMESSSFEGDPMARMIAAASAHYQAALPQPSPLTDDQLAQLTMPVYVAIASDHSLAGGRAAAERAGQLPQATVQTWPDTTHSLPMQATGELEPVLLEFFAAHDPS